MLNIKYYKILKLPSNASKQDLIKTYRKLVMDYHPDRHPNKSDKELKILETQFKEIKNAYEKLLNVCPEVNNDPIFPNYTFTPEKYAAFRPSIDKKTFHSYNHDPRWHDDCPKIKKIYDNFWKTLVKKEKTEQNYSTFIIYCESGFNKLKEKSLKLHGKVYRTKEEYMSSFLLSNTNWEPLGRYLLREIKNSDPKKHIGYLQPLVEELFQLGITITYVDSLDLIWQVDELTISYVKIKDFQNALNLFNIIFNLPIGYFSRYQSAQEYSRLIKRYELCKKKINIKPVSYAEKPLDVKI